MFDRADVLAAAAEGNAVALEYWHTLFEPLHFQEDATRRGATATPSLRAGFATDERPRPFRRRFSFLN